VLLGTVGENYTLTPAEKIELLSTVVKHVHGQAKFAAMPILTGVAETTTAGAVKFANDAKRAGVTGLMVLPALVYTADTAEAVHHFRTIATQVDLPQMIYNNPVSYKVDLKPADFLKLADCANVIAIKESSNDPRRITDIINLHGERFILFCGVDDLVMESFVLGATGWISGLVNAFPRENRLLWDAMGRGDWDTARKIYRWYTPLLHLDTMPKLVQYIKLAAQECGYGNERCRAPRLNLSGAEREQILKIIRDAIATRPK
jgi:1-pyrroline-4-hydroxy-2-carboxylate deaminase